MLTHSCTDGTAEGSGNDAALLWPGGWAYCCSVSARLDGYHSASQREILPAGDRPGAISTARPQSAPVY